jgi:predicted Zn-dependent protease
MPRWACLGVVLLAGCENLELAGKKSTGQVTTNYFGLQASDATVAHANYKNADSAVCLRVDSVGRKILLDNPQITVRPLFAAVLSESPEIFHLDQKMVVVTEGLVKRCRSDADLAALLSHELGRMVAEREVKVSREARVPEARPPIQADVGNPSVQQQDSVQRLELAKYDKERARARQPLPRPNPANLARIYLENAGYKKSDFEAAAPLFQLAEQNMAVERQMKGTVTVQQWSPK